MTKHQERMAECLEVCGMIYHRTAVLLQQQCLALTSGVRFPFIRGGGIPCVLVASPPWNIVPVWSLM